MEILSRTQQLADLFSLEKKVELKDSKLEIVPFTFRQTFNENEIKSFQKKIPVSELCETTDEAIAENKIFNYCVFTPQNSSKSNKAILLLHGLNERSWKKYLGWAEYLAESTGKSVILFPIAFHMNRTPGLWSNARALLPWVAKRKVEIPELKNSTFVNVALSSRISQNPFRFYTSGRETILNVWQLMNEIKSGIHPLFEEDTSVDLFGYSIGAFMSNVLLLANPDNIFDKSKLFMFCGGSIFSKMNANARDIIDSEANEKLHNYFTHDFFGKNSVPQEAQDNIYQAFKAMLLPEGLKELRESFFKKAESRIKAITLKNDTVIPTAGAQAAFGSSSEKILEEMDFPYSYSHQWPFPLNTTSQKELINQSFKEVFDKAVAFI